eukprot:3257910-Alexandrium_andersonii.AAC.1
MVAPPSWASNTARRLELHQKQYWMKLFNSMAKDLAEAAEYRELYWPEGTVPVPHDSFFLSSHPDEKERYKLLWEFTRDYDNLKILGMFALKNTVVVDGHMFQAGQRVSPGLPSVRDFVLMATAMHSCYVRERTASHKRS